MHSNAARVLVEVGAALRDIVRGAAGADAYRHYVDQLRRRRPERPPPSRRRIIRRELSARWDGVRRCC